MKNEKIRIAIFISGRGSNMLALIDEFKKHTEINAEISCVISDREDALGLKLAEKNGIYAKFLSPGTQYKTRLTESAELSYIKFLKDLKIDYIFLAGFMRILKGNIISEFENRIINIHPSLLPKFKGLDTHKRAIEAGEEKSGCTVHFVDSGMDTGKIIAQAIVSLDKNDTEVTLAEKVLEKEHILYPKVMRLIAENKIDYNTWEKIII